MPEDTPARQKVVQIERAAERAALFTRQLLAFSRKQVLDMRVLDLNVVITDVADLLGRLIGEHIRLEAVLHPSLGSVEADPGQIQQILLNLSTNARDAMPAGGVLTLETRNVVLDADYCATRPEVKPGAYVMLAVGDTGQGMDQETVSRVFEPFFTTKGLGSGTGLGLSTVYGIVKQHQGHISVYSEPGVGTAVKVYLPLVEGPVLPEAASRPMEVSPRGWETILVVEDDEIVHDLACEVLQTLGYQVISARHPQEALKMCRERQEPVHLLLTDVVLPGMDGPGLFERLSQSRPGLKVLFMSGYAETFVFGNGMVSRGLNFLQKPFTVERLAGTIRSVLDKPERGPRPD